MTLPGDAVFEAELFPGVALYDVSGALPRHPRKRWGRRDASAIDALFVHHSGALGPKGYRGLIGSARYSISHDDWAGTPYTMWAPYAEELDPEGRIVVYRANPDSALAWHTGGCNVRGVSLALQGNLTVSGPSPSQFETLEALIPWWCDLYQTTPQASLSWHSDAGAFGGRPKPSCPGAPTVKWLKRYRDG